MVFVSTMVLGLALLACLMQGHLEAFARGGEQLAESGLFLNSHVYRKADTTRSSQALATLFVAIFATQGKDPATISGKRLSASSRRTRKPQSSVSNNSTHVDKVVRMDATLKETQMQNQQDDKLSGIISIEGLIGAGKSTLKAHIASRIVERFGERVAANVVFVDEPVDEWAQFVDRSGTPILSLFYQNQTRWAFSFQMMAYISRLALLKAIRDKNPDALIIAERSLETDRYVFAQMLFDDGHIDPIEFKIYTNWFDTFASDFCPDLALYLKTPVDVAKIRIQSRGRDGEEPIQRSYLESLEQYTEAWLDNTNHIRTAGKPLPYVKLDACQEGSVLSINDLADQSFEHIAAYMDDRARRASADDIAKTKALY